MNSLVQALFLIAMGGWEFQYFDNFNSDGSSSIFDNSNTEWYIAPNCKLGERHPITFTDDTRSILWLLPIHIYLRVFIHY